MFFSDWHCRVRDDSLQLDHNNVFEYWDRGRKGIEEFLHQHRDSGACENNWICRKLGLDNVVIQPKSPEKGKGVEDSAFNLSSGSPTTSKKLRVSYLVLDDDDWRFLMNGPIQITFTPSLTYSYSSKNYMTCSSVAYVWSQGGGGWKYLIPVWFLALVGNALLENHLQHRSSLDGICWQSKSQL